MDAFFAVSKIGWLFFMPTNTLVFLLVAAIVMLTCLVSSDHGYFE